MLAASALQRAKGMLAPGTVAGGPRQDAQPMIPPPPGVAVGLTPGAMPPGVAVGLGGMRPAAPAIAPPAATPPLPGFTQGTPLAQPGVVQHPPVRAINGPQIVPRYR